jgi:hypothetical protein
MTDDEHEDEEPTRVSVELDEHGNMILSAPRDPDSTDEAATAKMVAEIVAEAIQTHPQRERLLRIERDLGELPLQGPRRLVPHPDEADQEPRYQVYLEDGDDFIEIVVFHIRRRGPDDN